MDETEVEERHYTFNGIDPNGWPISRKQMIEILQWEEWQEEAQASPIQAKGALHVRDTVAHPSDPSLANAVTSIQQHGLTLHEPLKVGKGRNSQTYTAWPQRGHDSEGALDEWGSKVVVVKLVDEACFPDRHGHALKYGPHEWAGRAAFMTSREMRAYQKMQGLACVPVWYGTYDVRFHLTLRVDTPFYLSCSRRKISSSMSQAPIVTSLVTSSSLLMASL